MTDEMTQDRLRVSMDGIAGPYLMVPLVQLARIRELLDRHAVRYWVDADAISLDGKPAIAVINFGRAGDAARIQTLLDEGGWRPGAAPCPCPTTPCPGRPDHGSPGRGPRLLLWSNVPDEAPARGAGAPSR